MIHIYARDLWSLGQNNATHVCMQPKRRILVLSCGLPKGPGLLVGRHKVGLYFRIYPIYPIKNYISLYGCMALNILVLGLGGWIFTNVAFVYKGESKSGELGSSRQ